MALGEGKGAPPQKMPPSCTPDLQEKKPGHFHARSSQNQARSQGGGGGAGVRRTTPNLRKGPLVATKWAKFSEGG